METITKPAPFTQGQLLPLKDLAWTDHFIYQGKEFSKTSVKFGKDIAVLDCNYILQNLDENLTVEFCSNKKFKR